MEDRCRVPVPPPPRRLYLASTLAAWRGVTPSERCRHKRSGERERRPPTVGLRFEIRKMPTAVKKNKFTVLFTIIFGTLSFPLAAASVRGRREKLVVLELMVVQKQVKTPNSSLQDRCRWNYIGRKGAAAILDAILNYTFLPHIWNGYPNF